jgi:putative sugar O-methyltransferase
MSNTAILENDETRAIQEEARSLYAKINGKNTDRYSQKSGIWGAANKSPLLDRLLNGSVVEAIRFAQHSTLIYFSQQTRAKEVGLIVDENLDYLKSIGFDLAGARPEIKESEFIDPQELVDVDGRPVSADFLYRLIMCHRVGDVLAKKGVTILEIGAGLGSFARTSKLINPNTKYVIVDLLDTMLLSYSFLRANFPSCKFQFVTDGEELKSLELESDFTFVPANLVDNLQGHDIDLVVNSNSLGEMQQGTSSAYLELIQNRLNVKKFYSLNRYLQPEKEASWLDETYQASYSTPLDQYWKVLLWEYCPHFVRNNRYTLDAETTLELYVERLDSEAVAVESLRGRSEELFAELQQLGDLRNHHWHWLIWESIRLDPRIENLQLFCDFLKSADLREYRYFSRMLAGLGVEVSKPYTKELSSASKRTLRTMTASVLRRLLKMVD